MKVDNHSQRVPYSFVSPMNRDPCSKLSFHNICILNKFGNCRKRTACFKSFKEIPLSSGLTLAVQTQYRRYHLALFVSRGGDWG